MKRILIALLAATIPTSFALGQAADEWPKNPIQLIVPFPAGTSTDVIGRVVGDALSKRLGTTVIVENRAGASGALGMTAVAQAAPDGYTLGIGTTSSQTVSASMNPNLPYDPVAGFEPVAMIGSVPYVLAVHPDLPAKTIPELIALAKERPGELTYGSVGEASLANLSTLLLSNEVGIELKHVPYKGAGQAALDLIAGRINMQFSTLGSTLPFIKDGKMRPLGVATAKRVSQLPDVPAIGEVVPGYESSLWFAVVAPAETPAAIVDRLNQEINAALQEPAVIEALAAQAVEVNTGTPAELGERVQADIAKWKVIVEKAGIKEQ